MSQSPLRMHSTTINGSAHNYSQKQLNSLPSQSGNNRGATFAVSPIRESLIKNTGAFILGNAGVANSGGMAPCSAQAASGGSPPAPINTHNASLHNFGELPLAGSPLKRERGSDRVELDFGEVGVNKDICRSKAQQQQAQPEHDVLDSFMSLPKQ